ncbi:MAG: carboxypeptidase-like regulatory domain-containing protein, partial [Planctomycetota bacterium]
MQRHTLTLLIGALVLIAGGGLVATQWLAEPETPTMRWAVGDEVEVPADPAALESVGEEGSAALERTAVASGDGGGSPDERIDLVLRGRIVDKWKAGVPAATVWLDYGRGGRGGGGGGGGPGNRQRRVPDPVQTDSEGRFAFQGQAFRNLRVWLQVAHQRFAPGQFDKDIGPVATEVDLGDLVLLAGGEVRGRVTDLEGNGIANAELRLQPENGNPLRQLRDRDKLLPAFVTDVNGYFVRPHLTAGDWSLTATAKRHTEGRSGTFAVEEELTVDIEDIRLGPGYELSGTVSNARSEPIAKATVVLRGDGRDRANGRGGPGGGNGPGGFGGQGGFGGREHRTTTDDKGRFFLEHLPGVPMRLETDADGYLDHRQDGIDPIAGQQLFVTMQDGLRIEGRVQDSDGKAVTRFAFRATRLRGLPVPGQGNADIANLLGQLRSGNVDAATRAQIESQIAGLRDQFGALREQFDRGNGGRRGPGQDG